MDADDTDDELSPNSRSTGPETSAQLLEVIEQAVEDKELDLARGGVHATTIVERLQTRYGIRREPSTIRDYLRHLEANGNLVRVRGLNPETHAPRISWLPPDHPHLSPSHLPENEL